jgi:hypothetical protein
MVNWMQAWWQVCHSWSFMRHAYRCGWKLYDGSAGAWRQRSYAMVYTFALLTPSARILPACF